MADIHPIRTETDYEHALAEIAALMEKTLRWIPGRSAWNCSRSS
jgi:antitoxin component HigA of HigAB toxin-antitoxin module